jgi:hypothetical protein
MTMGFFESIASARAGRVGRILAACSTDLETAIVSNHDLSPDNATGVGRSRMTRSPNSTY